MHDKIPEYNETTGTFHMFKDYKYIYETHDRDTFKPIVVKFKEWSEVLSLPFFNKVTHRDEFSHFYKNGDKLMLVTKNGGNYWWGNFYNSDDLVIDAD